MKCSVGGRFKLEVLNSKGEVVKSNESNNMLLDGFFTRWAASSNNIGSGAFFCVGTGSTPVAANQTSLANFLAGSVSGSQANTTSNDNELRPGNVYRCSTTHVATYPIGQIVGTITEIGANFTTNSSTNLDSRALLVDGGGTPTALTILSSEQLRVTYTTWTDINPAQSVTTIDFDGVSTTCTLEKLRCDNKLCWSVFLGPLSAFSSLAYMSSTQNLYNSITTVPNLTGTVTSTMGTAISSQGLGVRRYTITFSVSYGNIAGGIKYIYLANPMSSSYNMLGLHFDPPIAKTNTKTLTLNIDVTLTRV